jgi:putative spermidine/putrescine transport system permease protein
VAGAVVLLSGLIGVPAAYAMAVIYMVLTMIWLVIALRFVNPTQIVTRGKQARV